MRDDEELQRAVDAPGDQRRTCIGVNNRNLETLVIDAGRAERLIASIPARFVAIAESGVSARGDVERAAGAEPTRCSSARRSQRRRIPAAPFAAHQRGKESARPLSLPCGQRSSSAV